MPPPSHPGLWPRALCPPPPTGSPLSIQGPYLLITLVLAKMEDAGFELQLRGFLLLLGDGHHQRGDPLLQLADLPVPAWGTSTSLSLLASAAC